MNFSGECGKGSANSWLSFLSASIVVYITEKEKLIKRFLDLLYRKAQSLEIEVNC